MGKQNVGRAGIAQGAPGAEAVKLPDSVYDDGVVPATVGAQPRNEPRTEAVTERRRTERMDRKRQTVSRKAASGGSSEAISTRWPCGFQTRPQLLDALDRTPASWIHGADDMEDLHDGLLLV